MSRATLIYFKDGKPDTMNEYGNAWGGAARIWNAMFDKYAKDPMKEYDSWIMDKGDRLWKLAERTDIPVFERIVHASTFDYALVYQEHFKEYAQALRDFVKANPAGEAIDHLPAWADKIENSDAEAIGFWATSVSSNPWATYDEENDAMILYDLNTGDKHFCVFDYVTPHADGGTGE
jgi:hypothetical protein